MGRDLSFGARGAAVDMFRKPVYSAIGVSQGVWVAGRGGGAKEGEVLVSHLVLCSGRALVCIVLP